MCLLIPFARLAECQLLHCAKLLALDPYCRATVAQPKSLVLKRRECAERSMALLASTQVHALGRQPVPRASVLMRAGPPQLYLLRALLFLFVVSPVSHQWPSAALARALKRPQVAQAPVSGQSPSAALARLLLLRLTWVGQARVLLQRRPWAASVLWPCAALAQVPPARIQLPGALHDAARAQVPPAKMKLPRDLHGAARAQVPPARMTLPGDLHDAARAQVPPAKMKLPGALHGAARAQVPPAKMKLPGALHGAARAQVPPARMTLPGALHGAARALTRPKQPRFAQREKLVKTRCLRQAHAVVSFGSAAEHRALRVEYLPLWRPFWVAPERCCVVHLTRDLVLPVALQVMLSQVPLGRRSLVWSIVEPFAVRWSFARVLPAFAQRARVTRELALLRRLAMIHRPVRDESRVGPSDVVLALAYLALRATRVCVKYPVSRALPLDQPK